MCTTSGTLANGQVSCLNMAFFLKWARLSETAGHRVKISLILTPWGGERIYAQLLELWPLAKFHARI